MTNPLDTIRRLSGLHDSIGTSLAGFGGIVRCETCRNQWRISAENASQYTADGWPECCGYTMRWWTQRQIDAGEMPA